jgi:hypothetical protein
MNEPLDPLPPEISTLLDAERAAEFPQATLDRAWSRVEASVVVGLAAVHAVHPLRAWIAAHLAGVLGATFVLGLAAGAAVEHARARPSPPVVESAPIPVVASPPPTPSIASPVVPPTASAPPSLAPFASSATVPSAVHSGPRSSLAAERALLDDARSALTAGDAARALSLLDTHRARFPHPHLAEEREALATQALVLLGRYDEARARAAALHASAPNSVFLPVVDRALQSIP